MGSIRRRSQTVKEAPQPLQADLSSRTTKDEDFREEYVNSILGDERWMWRVCLLARLLNALLVRTYFNPDEHWQSLEVAHRMVFGYGHLTWEWKKGIRSYVHPLIFASMYKVLAITGLDTPWFMGRAPRLLQAVFAAACDVYLFKLTTRVFGPRPAFWALFCQMVNWFLFFCMTRTLSNSFETTLTIVALFYWPEGKVSKLRHVRDWVTSRQLALIIAALSCAIRPTNAIIWLYVGVIHLFQTPGKFRFLLAEVFPIGVGCLTITALIDRWMYGHWTLVPYNFLKFNFLSSGGDLYGTHPWHWYFSQGFPVMVFTFLPLSIYGIWRAKNWYYAGLIGWVLGLYSLLGHKEFRFVLPVLPLAMMFAGYALDALENRWTFSELRKDNKSQKETRIDTETLGSEDSSDPSSSSDERDSMKKADEDGASGKQAEKISIYVPGKFWWVLLGIFATNMPAALYTSLIHQRGGEAVMEYLAREASYNRVDSVLFLMPCHSTPLYSSLHKNVSLRFLDCSPSDEVDYIDEADRFMAQPLEFLFAMFSDGVDFLQMPTHIVLYDSLDQEVTPFLRRYSYRLERRFFHAHFPVDRELQGNVLLYSLCGDIRASSVM